jgi:hypothetical protein
MSDTALAPLDQVLAADLVGPGLLGQAGGLALGEHGHPDGLAGAVGQRDGAPHHLVGPARVDPEPERDLDGGVELGRVGLLGQRQRLGRVVQPGPVDLGGRLGQLLACHVVPPVVHGPPRRPSHELG